MYDLLIHATALNYFLGINEFGAHLWFVSVLIICYMLYWPTIFILKKRPFVFLLTLIFLFIFFVDAQTGELTGAYNLISADPFYRLFYHYFVFAIGILIALKKDVLTVNISPIILSIVSVFILGSYSYFVSNNNFMAIPLALIFSLCLSVLIISLFPWVHKTAPFIFGLSSITYELYLVHYVIIDLMDYMFVNRYVAYIATFIVSVLVALIVQKISTRYFNLLKKTAESYYIK